MAGKFEGSGRIPESHDQVDLYFATKQLSSYGGISRQASVFHQIFFGTLPIAAAAIQLHEVAQKRLLF